MKYILFFIIFSLTISASDLEFLKHPPLSSKCQAMLDKKENLYNALQKTNFLINRISRLEKSVEHDRKASRARVLGLRARLQMKLDEYKKKQAVPLLRTKEDPQHRHSTKPQTY